MFEFSEVKVDFKHAKFIERLLEDRAVNEKGADCGTPCDVCEENKAEMWCKTCSNLLCKICLKSHKMFLVDHSMMTLSERRLFEDELKERLKSVDKQYQKFEGMAKKMSDILEKQKASKRAYEEYLDDFVNKIVCEVEKRKADMQEKFDATGLEKMSEDASSNSSKFQEELSSLEELIATKPEQAARKLANLQKDMKIFEHFPSVEFKITHIDLKLLHPYSKVPVSYLESRNATTASNSVS